MCQWQQQVFQQLPDYLTQSMANSTRKTMRLPHPQTHQVGAVYSSRGTEYQVSVTSHEARRGHITSRNNLKRTDYSPFLP